MKRCLAIVGFIMLGACSAASQRPQAAPTAAPEGSAAPAVIPQRPIPYPVVPPGAYQQAVQEGTRTTTGRPGPRYWQNWADYQMRIRLLPESKRLEGSQTIRYHNRSPDTLQVLVLDLDLNFHAPGAQRLESAEVTGGVQLGRVAVAGQVLRDNATSGGRYAVSGTKLVLRPTRAVAPGETTEIAVDWSLTVPAAGAGERMGHDSDNLFYLAYFYPRMAMYDDVVGWHTDQFLGPAEFYHGFGNYQVTVEAPAQWLVVGTGSLTNADQVLAPAIRDRLRAAEASDTVVRVITAADLGKVTRPGAARLSWTFRADSVRDVAYSLTRESLWDVTRTPVGDRNGDGAPEYARAAAVYRASATRWREVARYAQHAVRFLSQYTGFAYPWPHMTAVEGEGIIGGGMEYPMMTLIGAYTDRSDQDLYSVTAHEIAHMWLPMIASTDERRYAWIDEGTTSFNENQAVRDFFPGTTPEQGDRASYLRVAQAELEGEIMRRSNYHYPGPAYGVATYSKPAAVLVALRGVLGAETFNRAYQEFFDRWAFRHPYPWDLWNTFENVSGQDLDWFWRSWYYETWTLDQAVGAVAVEGDSTRITVEDRGNAPMPARLTVTLAGGETVRHEIPVQAWLQGARSATVTVPGRAVRVQIDAENVFPDADRRNNSWGGTR